MEQLDIVLVAIVVGGSAAYCFWQAWAYLKSKKQKTACGSGKSCACSVNVPKSTS